MTQHSRDTPQFYLTAPSPCPYLGGKEERKVFTHLVGERAGELNNILTHGGFRRSQSIAYRPACEGCRACVSVRVVADDFRPTRGMRRIVKRNDDITGEMRVAVPTSEQYSVFRAYLDSRHRDGGMADMTVLDYAMMVEDSHIETRIIEYRRRQPDAADKRGDLLAVALTDVLGDGLSMVYSFFEPDEAARSLGTLMVLDHIARARRMGLGLRLSRLLGARLAQDGLQVPLPAAGAPDAGRLGAGRITLTSEQPRWRVDQDLATNSFVRRPIMKQIEQMAVVRHHVGGDRRMRPVGAPHQHVRIGAHERVVQRPRIGIVGILRGQPVHRRDFDMDVAIADEFQQRLKILIVDAALRRHHAEMIDDHRHVA